jgi:multiple antibiotic resistance protein
VWHTALVAFATFFVTIALLKVVPVFAVLTKEGDPAYRRRMAMKGTVIAGLILLIFGIWGDDLLRRLGISLPALRIGGGILLMLLAIDLVFERAPRAGPAMAEPQADERPPDIAAFPLAMPLLAGPASITAVVVLISEVPDAVLTQIVILGMLGLVLLITLVMLLLAGVCQRLIGETALSVFSRVLGILLMALAAELILNGLRGSEIFK